MSIFTFTKHLTNNEIFNRAQSQLSLIFGELAQIPLLDGILKTGIILTTGADNFVAHGLSRKFRGWIIISKSSNANVWENLTNSTREEFIKLNTSATVTVDIWVF